MADHETNTATKIPTAELDRLAREAGMQSIPLRDGGGAFFWSAGCNGVLARHLERLAELVTARALAAPAAQGATQEPSFDQLRALREGDEIGASDAFFQARPLEDFGHARKMFEQGFVRGFDAGHGRGKLFRPSAPVGQAALPEHPSPEMIEALRTGSRKDYPSDELCRVRYAALRAAVGVGQAEDAARLTTEQIEKIAHRRAWRYTHSEDPTLRKYVFTGPLLLEFVRALQAVQPQPGDADHG